MKHAVVTGAASGIGLDCCADLLERDWRVYALDRSRESLSEASRALQSYSRNFVSLACDVSSAASVTSAFEQIGSETDSIHALICSAGIFRTGLLLETTEADFDELFAVNTKGAWLAAKAALPFLEKTACSEAPARIVLVASAAAIRPKVGGGAYAASKAALTQMTRVLAVEMARKFILVNAVAPATVDTPMTRALAARSATSGYKLSGVSPLGRVAEPSDVTSVIRFLLSADANYLAGAIIPIDGGTSAAFDPG